MKMRKRRISNPPYLLSNKKIKPSTEDRIGELPDDVVGVIMSHLTLKEAARTSVLSHRWKHLWRLTTRLNFDAPKQFRSKRGNYIKWVKQVVKNCQGSYLDEFTVNVDLNKKNYHYLDEWISFAVRKRVKAININLCPDLLWGRFKEYSFIRSTSGGMEYLKSLCLKCVNITGENIEWLLSICPMLENLSLERSKDLFNLKAVGSSLKLRCFQVVDCINLKIIEICAPALVSFHYVGPKIRLKAQDLSCLVNLSIGNYWYNMKSFFAALSDYYLQLKSLRLNCSCYQKFLASVGQTQLINLKHLRLEMRWNSRNTLRILSKFINLCPLLHQLTLKFWKWNYNIRAEFKKANPCPHLCLKVVEIIGFDGHRNQIEVAMIILENAIWLKKFIINLRRLQVQRQIDESRRQVEQLKAKIPLGVELLISEDLKNYNQFMAW